MKLIIRSNGITADCLQEAAGWAADENKMTQKFGPDVVHEFLTNNEPLQLIVRGFQMHPKGYVFYPNDKVEDDCSRCFK